MLESEAGGVLEQMQALRAKGVKVITVDSDGPREGREAFVGTNNLEGGRELGRLAAQLRPDGGKAVAFVGTLGAQNAKERIRGFKEGWGQRFELVDSMEDGVDESKARNNVTDRHPEPPRRQHPGRHLVVQRAGHHRRHRRERPPQGFHDRHLRRRAKRHRRDGPGDDRRDGRAESVRNGLHGRDAAVPADHRTTRRGSTNCSKEETSSTRGSKSSSQTTRRPSRASFACTLEAFKGWLAEKGLEGS